MKKIKSITLALIFLVAGATNSYAQTESHTHKAAHGGVVQEAGSYHIEMVQGQDSIFFYVLDATQKTVSGKAVTGTAVFDFFNKTKASFALTTGKKNALFVMKPKANVFTFCTISLVVKGKNVTAKFKNQAVKQADIDHGHQH